MNIKKQNINTVYIGYDPKDHEAYEVLKFSLKRIATSPVKIRPLRLNILKDMGLYKREHTTDEEGQKWDAIDGKPFSTEFSFSRFLVPALEMYEGKALFMDSDMYVRADITELFDLCNMDYYPVYCVHHKYEPEKTTKMDGQIQEPYRRKNWSSLMMFNCGHDYNKRLTPKVVNTQTGRWLHGFGWLPDKEADIGRIPEEWNRLDGHSPTDLEAKNVHFTTGGPWFSNWNPSRSHDHKYIIEWNHDHDWLQMKGLIKDVV